MQNTDNQELHRKFEKKQSYFNEMERISRKFLQFQQLVYYSPLKDINPAMITRLELSHEGKRGQPSRKEEIYVINGQYQPIGPKSFEKLVLQIVQTIPRPKSSFGLIYINTLADGEAYNDFKKVLELLPVQYLLNLTKIYIVEATFLNKAFSCFSFGTNPSYVKNKTVNVDTLEQLSFKSQIDLDIIKKNLPKNIVQSFQKRQEPTELAGNRHHGMCMNEQVDYHQKRKKLPPSIQPSIVPPGFSRNKSQDLAFDHHHQQQNLLSTSSSTNKLGIKNSKRLIQQYVKYSVIQQIGPSGAPKALEMLIYYFNNNQQYLRVEGIFRKSVSIDDETQILKEINRKNYNYLATVDNPHLIANAIKRFLSNFREPIIPYDMFQTFMSYDTHPQYRNFVIEKIKQLPKTNRMIIFILFDFLKTSIIPNSPANKMGENNLCIIFGPVLMRSEVISIKDLIYAKKIIQVASFIFQDFQLIFGDRLAQLKIKRSSYKQYMKTQIQIRSSKQIPRKQQQLIQPPQSPQKGEQFNEQTPITPTFNIIHRTSEFIKQALQSNQSDGDQLQPQFTQSLPQHHKNFHANSNLIKQPFLQQANNNQESVNLFISMKIQNPGHEQAPSGKVLLHSQEALSGEEKGFP